MMEGCKFILYASYEDVLEKSAEQADALGCGAGTAYWWRVVELTDGRGAIVLHEQDWRVPEDAEGWTDPLSAWQRNNLVEYDEIKDLVVMADGE